VGRIVLVAASPQLPGLFPFQSWEALRTAGRIVCRDPETHPSVPYLRQAGFEAERLEAGPVSLAGTDLTQVGSPEDLRAARALTAAASGGAVTYLLGPEDGESFTRTVGLEAVRAEVEVEFVFHLEPRGSEVLRLAEVEQALRDPEHGCPWDLQQDHRSLARHLVEETYELLDAIESGEDVDIAEELGDVLLQVVFHAQIAADRGAFTLDDVAGGIADKLVRRHPHVFGDVDVEDAEQVKANWEVIKQAEKQRSGPFEGVPRALPALQFAEKIVSRSTKAGRPEPDPQTALAAIATATETLATSGARSEPSDDVVPVALGDLLLATVELGRAFGHDAEQALRHAADRLRSAVERGPHEG
jgi:XTP/dITP diphosphohydrolase